MKKHCTYNIFATILFIFAAGMNGLAQEGNAGDPDAFQQVYRAAQQAVEHDPFIRNGIYYTYPYYNAQGHPFLDTKEFGPGGANFRGKYYDGLSINYDLFNQQVILSWEYEGVLQMSLLAPEFLEGFQLKDKQFVKADLEDGSAAFFQVVSRAPGLACYYAWYKERREIRDSGNRSFYSFSDQKRRHYLMLDGRLLRYKSNRSFLKLFPETLREAVRSYISDAQIEVMESSDTDMDKLISYASSVMDDNSERGGE